MNIINYKVGKMKLLSSRSFFQASLHNTTSVLMDPYFNTCICASFENELCVIFAGLMASNYVFLFWMVSCFENYQKCLYHMVSMHIHYKIMSLLAQIGNYLDQYFMALTMCLTYFKTFYLLKVIGFVRCFF
jgi:hypothetical protein